MPDRRTRRRLPPIGRRWKKGESGNPKGRPPDVLREALLRRVGIDEIAELVVERLKDGDPRTLAAVMDRLWPKPPSEHVIEATGADGAPLIPNAIAGARERLYERLRRRATTPEIESGPTD